MQIPIALCAALALVFAPSLTRAGPVRQAKSAELKVRVFAAGHGDAILFTTPQGHNVLFDAGRATAGDHLVSRRLIPYFREAGIRRLDAFFVSHPHWDHYGDPVGLYRAAPFDVMYVNRDGEYALDRFIGYDNSAVKLPMRVLQRGDTLRFGGLLLEVLNPGVGGKSPAEIRGNVDDGNWRKVLRAENNRSLVILATFGKVRFLLTGDLQFGGEYKLLRKRKLRRKLRAHVLKLGHHGRGSSSAAWLSAVRPRYAISTTGDYDGRWHRPYRSLVERLRERRVRLLRTDIHGDIVFLTNGRRIRVKTYPALVHRPHKS